MKITAAILKNFNAGKYPSYNEAVNKRDNLPSHEQYIFLHNVRHSYFGIMSGNVTSKQIKEYMEVRGIA